MGHPANQGQERGNSGLRAKNQQKQLFLVTHCLFDT